MEQFEEVGAMLHSGLQELSTIWEEIVSGKRVPILLDNAPFALGF